MLKLVRLARLPRLIKLMDEAKFKKSLQHLFGSSPRIEEIRKQAWWMGAYTFFKLVLILLFMTFGVGCLFYLLSDFTGQLNIAE